jgi:phosphoribosylglycinamide formyltransferase-1/phosphoribosylamine--glycine ligase/phosphoribosylglycinamide formyltransferase/phosphoribosylformylglycinamidine cyclo-ligase
MSPDPSVELERVRALCRELPETAERPSHGSPGFFILKGKFFAYFWHNHHGDGITCVHVKTNGREEQEMLMERDPDGYFIPPYLGPGGWIGMRLDRPDTDWARVADRLRLSWEMVARRRLLESPRS